MISIEVERYFRTAQIRYGIFLRRERGEPPPWTEVPIFNQYRFCNVFREDDRVTRWVKRHVRDPLAWDHNIVYAMTVARFFNLPSTLEILVNEGLLTTWNPDRMRQVLAGKKPMITGAYMVKTPLRKPKLEGLLEIFEPVWKDRRHLYNYMQETSSLQMAHQRLMDYPWIGGFMAYEIVSDLRHTSALGEAFDTMRWAHPGPGASRGLRRLCSGAVDGKLTGEPVALMQELLTLSQQDRYWPTVLPAWEMREVEHWLCEEDKYERARLGEGRPKQLFRPERGRDV